jgi:N-methylhydantoinase A
VEIAAEIGFSRVLVPEGAATFSALGLLVGDLQSDAARSFLTGAPADDAARIEQAFAGLEQRAIRGLGTLADAPVAIERGLDVRYAGQRWELRVAARGAPFDAAAWQQVAEDFHAAHERAYRFHDASRPLEVTCLRVRARASMPKPRLREVPPAAGRGDPVAAGTRRVVSGGREVPTQVYSRADLAPGHAIDGPAMVEEADTALWIPAGSRATIDGFGNCIVDVGGRP